MTHVIEYNKFPIDVLRLEADYDNFLKTNEHVTDDKTKIDFNIDSSKYKLIYIFSLFSRPQARHLLVLFKWRLIKIDLVQSYLKL